MLLNEITIVITTYFSEEKLIRCLKSINNKCKVIVIENSKDNELKRKLNENYKNVECKVLDENLGFAEHDFTRLIQVTQIIKLPLLARAVEDVSLLQYTICLRTFL